MHCRPAGVRSNAGRKRLEIPAMTRKLLSKYQVLFLLLGENHLASLGDPPSPAPQQKFIYFGKTTLISGCSYDSPS